MEVSLYHGALPQATSVSLAAMLLGRLTSPTRAAQRAELQLRLQDALNAMEPIDREILTLRHFEELNNNETAQVLGIGKTAASNRYIRALKRLKDSPRGNAGFLRTMTVRPDLPVAEGMTHAADRPDLRRRPKSRRDAGRGVRGAAATGRASFALPSIPPASPSWPKRSAICSPRW